MTNNHSFYQPIKFLLLAYAFSWLAWLPLAFLKVNLLESPWIALGLLGLYAPAVLAVLFTAKLEGRITVQTLLRRLVDIRSIKLEGFVVIFLLIPALTMMAVFIDSVTGGVSGWSTLASEIVVSPVKLLVLIVQLLFLGALSEELGWRSHFLDALQARMPAITASLMVGIVWVLWLLPLFLLPGMMWHDEIGLFTPAFWRFGISLIALSVLFSSVYNANRQNLFALVLIHLVMNLTGNLTVLTPRADTILTILYCGVALVIALSPKLPYLKRHSTLKFF